MPVHQIDPLTDPRWPIFIQQHPQASVFHTPQWLKALKLTYGYEPFVLTTAPPGKDLEDGIAFCRVRSWLTGRRLVSLPFADHCQPLAGSPGGLRMLLGTLREEQACKGWKYIEMRLVDRRREVETGAGRGPRNRGYGSNMRIEEKETGQGIGDAGPGLGISQADGADLVGASAAQGFARSAQYFFHSLDLSPCPDALFRGFHKSCIQRKIKRAEKEALVYERGCTGELLEKFYRLFLLTRRRHRLPPQPRAWFQNLLDGLDGQAEIHLVSKDGRPVASILTLFFKQTLVYKYGCSDVMYHTLGGMPFLFWKAIEEGKRAGAREFDLGRTDRDDPGLVAFKGHLGAACSTLTYLRYPQSARASPRLLGKRELINGAFSLLPDGLLTMVGRLLYRHVG